jgi:hypothetical protein
LTGLKAAGKELAIWSMELSSHDYGNSSIIKRKVLIPNDCGKFIVIDLSLILLLNIKSLYD